jgi:hypothetical protein
MERAIMAHFSGIHNSVPGPAGPNYFPTLKISRGAIRGMARNVCLGKAITFDGVDDSLFNFRDGCHCRGSISTPCPPCLRRLIALE